MLAFIPSPSQSSIHIGPLAIRAYGVLIAVAVVVAATWTSRRWEARGEDPADITQIAIWAVPAGVIGARLYHVITDFELYRHNLTGMFKIWDGGLGIWGAIAAGAGAAVVVARRRGMNVPALLDAAAPALPLAQAIGRLGNYFNQELFGRPTRLPWGLEIDPVNRPSQYFQYKTFHPTFLYELLWDLVVVAIVLAVERRRLVRPGYLFAVYVTAYTFGRFFTEWMRIDFAHKFLGLRLNDWTSIVVFVAGAGFVIAGLRRPGDPERAVIPSREGRGAPPQTDGPSADHAHAHDQDDAGAHDHADAHDHAGAHDHDSGHDHAPAHDDNHDHRERDPSAST